MLGGCIETREQTDVERLFGLGPRDAGDRVRRADDATVELDRLALGHALAQRRTTQLRSNCTHHARNGTPPLVYTIDVKTLFYVFIF